jgi:hypothetical protein
MAELKRTGADRDTGEVYEVRRRAVNDRNSSITEAMGRGRIPIGLIINSSYSPEETIVNLEK